MAQKTNGKLFVLEIWRYPVKSLAGEQLETAEVGVDGIVGDRRVLVYDEKRNRLITSRTHPKLLGLKANLGKNGQPLINGLPWDDPEAVKMVTVAAGANAHLLEWDGPERYDVLPLLVATDGAIKEFGYDHRRLRPNIVIGGVEGLAERDWPGRRMRIGKVVIEFAQLRARCVMTTYDPDTQKQNQEVLRSIGKKFGGTLALDTSVVQGGSIKVGDVIEFVE